MKVYIGKGSDGEVSLILSEVDICGTGDNILKIYEGGNILSLHGDVEAFMEHLLIDMSGAEFMQVMKQVMEEVE